jgi:hypothetical protein
MNIKSRFKRLFRSKPQKTLADLVAVLESLEREARNLAEQTFEIALGIPPRGMRDKRWEPINRHLPTGCARYSTSMDGRYRIPSPRTAFLNRSISPSLM